jgi:deoxyribodipyrimidine photo-lyase
MTDARRSDASAPVNAVWFRADLRVSDNAALAAACRDRDARVIAFFLLAPDQWREHGWSPARVDLVRRTLGELSRSLAALNIPLVIRRADRFADAPAALGSLVRERGVTSLHFNREYEVNEVRRDDAVARELRSLGVEIHAHHDQCVMEPGSVVTKESKTYTVFTPFKKAWIAAVRSGGGISLHATPAARAVPAAIDPDPVPDSLAEFTGLARPDLWPAGEDHALDRLREFARGRIDRYKELRDLPAVNATSVLSPYLAIGAISPRQCVRAALDANAGSYDSGSPGAVHWISEIVWREFYRHLTAAFPRLCMGRAFRPETEALEWRDAPDEFAAWCEARTGIPIIDAAMRQLLQTGWMHNRLRMIVAMFLTKNLLIDWRRGESFFMRHLVDGDLAQNNGGWQWSASTGTDAAPYFRIFNPVTQSRTFDPGGEFLRKFLPELAPLDDDAIHEPWKAGGLLHARVSYPAPIVDLSASRARALEAWRKIKGQPVPTRPFDDA